MPIGQAFFTGSNSSSITNNSTRPAIHVSSENKKPIIGAKVKKDNTDKVDKDKEDKEDKDDKIDNTEIEMKDIEVEDEQQEEDFSYLYDKEYDSDSDIDENDKQDNDDSQWPPEDYDPMSPLSLPIGTSN
jgi:hypothetical protein